MASIMAHAMESRSSLVAFVLHHRQMCMCLSMYCHFVTRHVVSTSFYFSCRMLFPQIKPKARSVPTITIPVYYFGGSTGFLNKYLHTISCSQDVGIIWDFILTESHLILTAPGPWNRPNVHVFACGPVRSRSLTSRESVRYGSALQRGSAGWR